jgi:hypothetical protein
MNAILDEHEIRGAVQRLAAGAATPALPGPAILAAGARRRTRRRAGAAGALALAATLAVSVSWSAASGGSSAGPGAGAPTTTNAFTAQLGRMLEQVLPGAKVTASMFTDTNPVTRHQRDDVFPLRITYHGHVSDAFLSIHITPADPDYIPFDLCHESLTWHESRSDCTSKEVAGGGVVHSELENGPGTWTSRSANLGGGSDPLAIIESDFTHGGTMAILQVRGGSHVNDSALTAAKLGAALEDPRFTAFLADFSVHPEHDPYGPVAKIPEKVVASGSVGAHNWSLSFAVISDNPPGDSSKVNNNCDYWDFAVDGKPMGSELSYTCMQDGSAVHNPPPTDKSHPYTAYQLVTGGVGSKPKDVIGSILNTTVPAGTARVEASFDDQPAKLTAKVFTVHGDIPYFALVKPDSAKPDWKIATVRCLDKDGKETGKLYFAAPETLPPTK